MITKYYEIYSNETNETIYKIHKWFIDEDYEQIKLYPNVNFHIWLYRCIRYSYMDYDKYKLKPTIKLLKSFYTYYGLASSSMTYQICIEYKYYNLAEYMIILNNTIERNLKNIEYRNYVVKCKEKIMKIVLSRF
jgi:hypothetical protein